MPLIKAPLIVLLILLPMSFFYFVVSTKQNVIDIGLFFLLAGLKGVLYPFIFHKLNLKTPLILLLGGISSIFVFFISNFMKGDSSGFHTGRSSRSYIFSSIIPCYLISTFLQVIVLKNTNQ